MHGRSRVLEALKPPVEILGTWAFPLGALCGTGGCDARQTGLGLDFAWWIWWEFSGGGRVRQGIS